MRNLAKVGAVVTICLGMTVGAWADGRPRPNPPRGAPAGPFARVSVPRTPLYFGQVPGPGPRQLKAKMTARVTANRPFRLAASFRGLTQEAGQAAIPSKHLKVTINGKEVPVGTKFVEIAAGGPTPGNGADVPVVIEIGVKGAVFYPAGRYGGNLVLSVM